MSQTAEEKADLEKFLVQRDAFRALSNRLDNLRSIVHSEACALQHDFGLRLEVDSCGKDFVRVSVSMLSQIDKKEAKS